MITIGVKDIIIHQGYLSTCTCENCLKTEENEITIFCKAFVLGPVFWQWKWFAWDRQAYVICNNCKKHSNLSQLSGNLKQKAEQTFVENKIPNKYYVLCIILVLLIFSNIF